MNITGEDMLFAGVAVAFVAAVFLAQRFSGPPLALRRWAEERGHVVLRATYRGFAKGPFGKAGALDPRHVFRASIRTADGAVRGAWVRCDYDAAGERVEVVWDDAPAVHDSEQGD